MPRERHEYRIVRGGGPFGSHPPIDQCATVSLPRSVSVFAEGQGFRVASGIAEDSPDPAHALFVQALEYLDFVTIDSQDVPWLWMHRLLAHGRFRSLGLEPASDGDDTHFSRLQQYSGTKEPMYYAYVEGLSARVRRGPNGGPFLQDHFGQVEFILAESGFELDTPLVVEEDRILVLDDLLEADLLKANYFEDLSWFLPAVVYFHGGNHTWQNRFGQTLSVNVLLQLFIERHQNNSTCFGTHFLYCLADLLYVHRFVSFLTDKNEACVLEILQDHSRQVLPRLLERTRRCNRWSTDDWRNRAAEFQSDLKFVGHHLEWLTLFDLTRGKLDDRLKVPREALLKLIAYGSAELHDVKTLPHVYGDLCHAVHALRLAAQYPPVSNPDEARK